MEDDVSKERTALDAKVQGAANRVLLEAVLPTIRSAARNQGYAVAVHGSLDRDIDLIAVPWREGAMNADSLLETIRGAITGVVGNCTKHGEAWTNKPHGRMATTLLVYCGENYIQIDLSVMPVILTVVKETGETP